jgi:hypothetical protein
MDMDVVSLVCGLPTGEIVCLSHEGTRRLDPPEPLRDAVRLDAWRILGLGRDAAHLLSMTDGACWSVAGVTHVAALGSRAMCLKDGRLCELSLDENGDGLKVVPLDVCFERPAEHSKLFVTDEGAFLLEGAELRFALWQQEQEEEQEQEQQPMQTGTAKKLSDKYLQVAMFDCGFTCPVMVLCRNGLVPWNPTWTVMALKPGDELDLRELPVHADGELWLMRHGRVETHVRVTAFHGRPTQKLILPGTRAGCDATVAVCGPFVYFDNGAIFPRRASVAPDPSGPLPVPFPVSWILGA